MSVKMMFKWYKAGKSIEEVAKIVDTSPKNVERLLRKYYPFLFDEEKPLEFKEHSILVVDPSFNANDELSDVKVIPIHDCEKCSKIYEKLSGLWRQPINVKSLVLDRVPTKFSWKDYRIFLNLLEDSVFPIVLITEDPDKVTKSVKKEMKLIDVRIEKVEKFKDVKTIAKMILKEEDRDKIFEELRKTKQPWFWVIGWLREILSDLDEFTRDHYYRVLSFIDENKFNLKDEYLMSMLSYSLFPISQNVRLTFPMQWKKKKEKKDVGENKRLVKKIKVKNKTKKTKKTKKKKSKETKARNKKLDFWCI